VVLGPPTCESQNLNWKFMTFSCSKIDHRCLFNHFNTEKRLTGVYVCMPGISYNKYVVVPKKNKSERKRKYENSAY
jgi:hypothetical protein